MEEAKRLLSAELDVLCVELERQGGRGVELANKIDRIRLALDALDGNLTCPHCEASLT